LTVVLDTSVLLYFLNDQTKPPLDPRTGQEVTRCQVRVRKLIDDLAYADERIIVPTPVVSEALGRAGAAGPQYLQMIDRQRLFRVEAFNILAAVEAAELLRAARPGPAPNENAADPTTRAKLKFDTMIMAIARVHEASTVYSDDKDIRRLGAIADIAVVGIADIALPAPGLFD
jgi:predicted nucleic acid-binding protein